VREVLDVKASLAPLLFSSVLFAALFGRREKESPPPPSPSPMGPPLPPMGPPLPPMGPPDASNLPPIDRMPLPPAPSPSWPEPPRPPNTVHVQAGHRYRVIADVQAFSGVGLATAAQKLLAALQLDDVDLVDHETTERAGAGEVTRVTFDVTSLVDASFVLDTQITTGGAGNVWIVSVVEVPR
jgi:hypothetical protein